MEEPPTSNFFFPSRRYFEEEKSEIHQGHVLLLLVLVYAQ